MLAGLGDRGDVHERHTAVEQGVDHADAVRADDSQTGLAGDGGETFLLGDAVFLGGLGIAGRENDGAADAGFGAVEHDLLDGFAGGGDHGAIDDFGKVADIGIAGVLADFLVAPVHRIGSAVVVLHVEQHPLPERAGAGGCADHRDAGGVEEARELFPAVDAGSPILHFCRLIDVPEATSILTGSATASLARE